jgi:hypothetical protein
LDGVALFGAGPKFGITEHRFGSSAEHEQTGRTHGAGPENVELYHDESRGIGDDNNANDSFDKFKDNLDDLQGIRDDIKDRVEKVRDLQGRRIAAWTKEVSGMNDKDMRKMTNDQIDKAKADFDVLDKQLREVGGDANDLTGLLQDLKKYFASSFTPDSIKTSLPMVEKARASGQEMVKDVDTLRNNLYKQKKEVKGTSGN